MEMVLAFFLRCLQVVGEVIVLVLLLGVLFLLLFKICCRFDIKRWVSQFRTTNEETLPLLGGSRNAYPESPLLPNKVEKQLHRKRKIRVFVDVMAHLRHCRESPRRNQLDSILDMHDWSAIVTSSSKAIDFAEFCSTLPLKGLDIGTLVTMVVALEKYADRSEVSTCIKDVFFSTEGLKSVQLKFALDKILALHYLIFVRIKDKDNREMILDHLKVQHERLPVAGPRPIQIVSDIDDTFYSVLFDRRFPTSTVYPGVLQLYEEFAKVSGRATDKVVFLTARPEFLRRFTLRYLRSLGLENITLLMGSFSTMFMGKNIARRKLVKFREYKRLFPEYQFVFIGDNGQGDIDLGKVLLASKDVSCVAIHDIFHQEHRLQHPGSRLRYRGVECAQHNLGLFATYIGATIHFYKQGIISLSAVANVTVAAASDFSKIQFSSKKQAQCYQEELLAELNQACSLFPDRQKLELMSKVHLSVLSDDEYIANVL